MNSGLSRFDLKKIHQMLAENYRYLQVTGGTFAWAALYAFVLFLWWKWDGPPELSFLGFLALAGVLLFSFLFEYPLTWIRTRQKEMRQVTIAYYDFMDSLPPASRVGQPAKAFWDALVKLKYGIGDPDQQLVQERASDSQDEV